MLSAFYLYDLDVRSCNLDNLELAVVIIVIIDIDELTLAIVRALG